MARVPQRKPAVPPQAGSVVFQRETSSPEAFGAGAARAQDERVRAGARIADALKESQTRRARAEVGAQARIGDAKREAVENIGINRANSVLRINNAQIRAAREVEQATRSASATDLANAGVGEANIGRALSGIGENIAAASARVRLRQEANDRTVFMGETVIEVENVIAQEANRGTNFGDADALDATLLSIQGVLAKAMVKVQGHTTESQLMFSGNLKTLFVETSKRVREIGIQTNISEELRLYNDFVKDQIDFVQNNPENAGAAEIARENVLRYLDQNIKLTHTPEQLLLKRDVAFAEITQTLFSQAVILGDLEGASEILNSDIAKSLTETQERQLENTLLKARFVTVDANAKAAAKVARVTSGLAALGEDMTPAILLALEGVPASAREPQTLAEQVAELEEVRKAPLSTDQIDKLGKAFIADPANKPRSGGSKQAIALENLNDNLQAAVSGSLSPLELGQFFNDVALATALNPLTGERIELPAFIKAGLNQMGLTDQMLRDPNQAQLKQFGNQILQQRLGQEQAEVSALAPAVEEGTPPAEAGATPALAAGTPTDDSTPAQDVAQARENITRRIMKGVEPGFFTQDKTIFDLGSKFTGPIAKGARGLGRFPLIGPGGGEFSRVGKSIPIMFNNLVNALRENMRSETERKNIKELLSVDPKLIDNTADFQTRMLGVDDGLQQVQIAAMRSLEKAISKDRREQLTDTIQLISAFRINLVPPHFEGSIDEIEKSVLAFEEEAPEGTRYIFRIHGGEWLQKTTRGPKAARGE